MKQISLNSIRVILEVYVVKNPTCFSCWSVRPNIESLLNCSMMPYEFAECEYGVDARFITLDNGFSYLEAYCGFGDDTWIPYLLCFYIDENDYIQVYLPHYGNFSFNEVEYGALADIFVGGFQSELNSLVEEYGESVLSDLKETDIDELCENGIVGIIYVYGQKYGLEDSESGTISDFIAQYDTDSDDAFDILRISSDYCMEDIKSNVEVV